MVNDSQPISYKYELQWLFPIQENFFESERTLQGRLYSFIRLVEGQNITEINFRDSSTEIIRTHTLKNPAVFGKEFATKKLISYIKRTLKKDSRVYYVELIRK
jgi:hypothetical protein